MKEADLQSSFENRKPALAAVGKWVIKEVVSQLEIELHSKEAVERFFQIPPKPRVKETNSFLEKALIRKPKDNPLQDITDQVGVRFVVLLLEEIDLIGKIIQSKDCWSYEKDRDYEEERLAKPDYFAYQSDHYVIRVKDKFIFDEVTIPSGMPCEIQIRTILQHAYAEMSHDTSYKPSVKLPDIDQKHIRRSLAKGSALIETTDDIFKEIKNRFQDYDKEIEALLFESSQIYKNLTGKSSDPLTELGKLITSTYHEELKGLTPEQLKVWVDQHPWFGDKIKEKRNASVFYRDSIVVLLGLLVTKNEIRLPKKWPIDSRYLEEFYTLIGISSNNLF